MPGAHVSLPDFERRSFSAPPAEAMRRIEAARPGSFSDVTASNQPTFHDLLDAVNPLQHIPVVSWIYREMSGDQISAQARIVGDTLYGGAAGLVSGMFNALVEQDTGKDVGGHIMAMLQGKPAAQPTATAAAAPTATAAATPAAAAAATTAPSAAATPTAAAMPASAPTSVVANAPTPAAASGTPPTPSAGQQPPAAQGLSQDSQAALARLAADLHSAGPGGATPAAFMAGGAAAVPAAATTANGTPLPAKPTLAARAGGNAGTPSGMGLADYWRRPVAQSTTVPLPTPPLAGTGSAQAATNYAQALELSKQLQNYYQSPDAAQPPVAAPAPAATATP